MPIKSFRGQIEQGGQDKINLHTNDGTVGYRIVKFQTIGSDLTGGTQESTVKIYTIEQTSVDGVVNFADNTLLGVAFYEQSGSSSVFGGLTVIFDNMTFNQDIYITHTEGGSTAPVNYYIELEQVKLDLNRNTVATLKDIKNIEQRSQI